MKKILLGLIAVLLVIGSTQAQDTKKAYSKAKKALGIYNLDPNGNKAKLKEAADEISVALSVEGSVEQGASKTWQLKGDIYNETVTQLLAIRQLNIGDPAELPQLDKPALAAAEAYSKALELAVKKYEIKDALRGLRAAQTNLYNMGIFSYEDKNYEESYNDFRTIVDIHNNLKKNNAESSLDGEEDYNNQLYITGLAALNSGNEANAKTYFEELYNKQFDKPAIYEALYKIYAVETSPEDAYKYLQTGREKFPEDVSILFAEINHFLRVNKLDELIDKIKAAIAAEPENISLYSTLGNVYDNLFQSELEAGNVEKSEEHFANALDYYNQALAKDPNFFDATYSIGALYYNKAAEMTKELNVLADDYSKEGIKKYDAKKAEIFEEFDKALPFFQKAEGMNPNDLNTLIALKEIFARKDQLEVSNEFKMRFEKVQGGGSNDASYFKN